MGPPISLLRYILTMSVLLDSVSPLTLFFPQVYARRAVASFGIWILVLNSLEMIWGEERTNGEGITEHDETEVLNLTGIDGVAGWIE